MFSIEKFIKILIGIIIIFIAILLGQIWINKGKLIIRNIQPPFVADFPTYGKIPCNKEPCVFKVNPKHYNVTITKEGYFESSKVIEIKRWKEATWEAELKIIPVLVKLEILPDIFIDQFYPNPAVGENPYAIDQEGNVFFINLETGQFFEGIGKDKILIAEFTNITNAKIYSGENFAYLVANNDLYEIDLKKKTKYQIYSGINIENIKSSEDTLFLKESGDVFAKFNESFTFEQLPTNTDLDLICSLDRNNIFAITYTKNSNNVQTNFLKIDLDDSNNKITKIIDSKGSLVPIKVECENNNSILIQLENKEAYRLKF